MRIIDGVGSFSVIMSYEKAGELPYLKFMFERPIVLAGVGVSGN